MNRIPFADREPGRLRKRATRHTPSFTLVELLCVMGIMVIMFAIAGPAITSVLENSSLNQASQQVADQVNLARQISSSKNITVEFRVFNLAGVTTSGYTAIQLWTNNSTTATWNSASQLSILPRNMAISASTTLSSAFSATSSSNMATGASYGPVSGAKYYPFEFRPSGIVTPVPALGMTSYCFTVLPSRYSASTYTSLSSPINNYAVIQINNVTATPITYRP